MTVLDVFSWLPAKEISIEELEQIFIKHLNGTYEGEYKVLLEMEYETKYHNKAEYKDIVKILAIGGLKQKDASNLGAIEGQKLSSNAAEG